MTNSIPVLMYHYISKWENPISVHPDLFESHCKAMAEKGWKGISLKEAEDFFISGKPLPKKSVLITFDDGFLDNYVYAYPILKKYGHKGVIFTVSGKIETSGSPRHTIEDVWNGICPEDELPRIDTPYVAHELGFDERQDLFINWEEARAMEASGVMHISAHSTWHQTVFVSPEFDGFYLPEKRTRTFDRIAFDVPWGLPRFKARPGLANRAFIPSPQLIDAITQLVPQKKKEAYAFSQDSASMKKLQECVAAFTEKELGTYEDTGIFRQRLREELATGKDILEKEMGRSERSLCWPWGAWCQDALVIGKELGFQTFFSTDMGANPTGFPEHIKRFKAKAKPAKWLLSRLSVYSKPWLAKLYAKIRI